MKVIERSKTNCSSMLDYFREIFNTKPLILGKIVSFKFIPDLDATTIPELSEFVDGFTFKIYCEFENSIEDVYGWYTYTMGKDNWRSMDEIKYELIGGNIRKILINN